MALLILPSPVHAAIIFHLPCKRLQADEIWSFVHSKQKNVPPEHRDDFGYGDVWTFTAIDADTKLVPSWLVGERTLEDARAFVADLAERLANRVQLTTDGHRMYLDAVESTFGADIDYAQLHKIYKKDTRPEDTRYTPAKCIGVDQRRISGRPDPKHISTSYVERQNLTMRMGCGASPGSPMPSQRRSRTLPTPLAFTTCTTTSAVSKRA